MQSLVLSRAPWSLHLWLPTTRVLWRAPRLFLISCYAIPGAMQSTLIFHVRVGCFPGRVRDRLFQSDASVPNVTDLSSREQYAEFSLHPAPKSTSVIFNEQVPCVPDLIMEAVIWNDFNFSGMFASSGLKWNVNCTGESCVSQSESLTKTVPLHEVWDWETFHKSHEMPTSTSVLFFAAAHAPLNNRTRVYGALRKLPIVPFTPTKANHKKWLETSCVALTGVGELNTASRSMY